jgi:hypothetical protein
MTTPTALLPRKETIMSKQSDTSSPANADAGKRLDGKTVPSENKPKQAEDITAANEAANAEFNGEASSDVLGNRVGGLRGSSD